MGLKHSAQLCAQKYLSYSFVFSEISGFRCDVEENFALLGCYAA